MACLRSENLARSADQNPGLLSAQLGLIFMGCSVPTAPLWFCGKGSEEHGQSLLASLRNVPLFTETHRAPLEKALDTVMAGLFSLGASGRVAQLRGLAGPQECIYLQEGVCVACHMGGGRERQGVGS